MVVRLAKSRIRLEFNFWPENISKADEHFGWGILIDVAPILIDVAPKMTSSMSEGALSDLWVM